MVMTRLKYSYQDAVEMSADLREVAEDDKKVDNATADLLFESADAIEYMQRELERLINGLVSERQRGTIFGYIKEAFANWPETHPFQPYDPERLRDWVRIRAGHCRVMNIPNAADVKNIAKLITSFVTADESRTDRTIRYIEVLEQEDGGLMVLAPKTMKTKGIGRTISPEEFNNLTRSINDILEPIVGFSIDDYVKQAKGRSEAATNA